MLAWEFPDVAAATLRASWATVETIRTGSMLARGWPVFCRRRSGLPHSASGCVKPATGYVKYNFMLQHRMDLATESMDLPPNELLLITLLTVQGIVGGVDTLINHEILERLPTRVEAHSEIGLHALREAIYGILFAATAWYAWHGTWGLAIAALLLAAILVDAVDEFVENRIRILPQNERMLHFVMIMNLGLLAGTVVLVLLDWAPRPTAVLRVSHGPVSWLLSLLSLAALCWALRDAAAWHRLGKLRRP